MNINFNISPSLLKRLVEAIESLAANYATVHSATIAAVDASKSVDRGVGKVYYQDDRKIYEEELDEKRRRAIEYGEG